MPSLDFLQQVFPKNSPGTAATLANVLHITQPADVTVLGMSQDAVYKHARFKSRNTLAKLKDTADVISGVAQWSRGTGKAFTWFRWQPLPLFDDKPRKIWSRKERMRR